MKQYLYCACVLLAAVFLLPSLAFRREAPQNKKSKTESENEEPTVISVINGTDTVSMNLEDYILGVVLAEMPASYNSDALKAQAVAARTYALSKITSGAHSGNAVCTDFACCQAYISPEDYTGGGDSLNKVKSAVDETASEIMTYNSEPIVAAFHSMSAGKTTSAEEAWGSKVPYLVSVDSALEQNEESFETTVVVSIEDFKKSLASVSADYSGGLDISVPVRDPSGYVKSLTIGGVTFSGNTIRNLFSLRSTNFNLGLEHGNAVFYVRGYGHGVGMSQHGANLLAESGADYKEILQTYYTGITIEKAKEL